MPITDIWGRVFGSFPFVRSNCPFQHLRYNFTTQLKGALNFWKFLFVTENYGGNSQSKPTTGCVNISVLMPVLAVAVMSLLLFVHLVIRGKPTPKDQMIARRMKQSEETSSRQSEASTSVIEEPIEMHVNKHTSQPPVNGHVSRSPDDAHASRSPVDEHASHSSGNMHLHLSRAPVNEHGSQLPNQEAQNNNVTQF